ncbi:long-chain acyl-CoA synthetase [Desulfobotulus alkaliphilus]|uniref:Long-chain acyl-CoA synthetase n=1 Tax=Desulfobotulus alkaliphilus TaxID=622671 RepID=A0A562S7E5_9BACT|nr:long-chain fatty acid--CoA ligase [Desulfobotulus alkaliphilus]TWI77322.1 long-chain acyl-CoA synthetase [Desulfobotulus alkaliphilus]
MHQQAQKWYLTRQTFPELFQRNVLRFPERTAQMWRRENGRDDVVRLPYRELGEIVQEIGTGLLAEGIQKGDRVAIVAPTVPQWMWADYAVLSTGAITVAIHPALSDYEMTEQIRDSGARLVFVYGKTVLERLLVSGTKSLKSIVWMGPGENSPEISSHAAHSLNLVSLKAFREKGRDFFQKHPLAYGQRWRSVQPDDPMTLIYTSGTTGQAKGVLHTHESMTCACIRDLCAVPLLTENDCLLSFLPLSHSYERQCGHGTAMFAAVPIAYGQIASLGDDIRLFKPTYMMGVPHTYAKIYARVEETLKGAFQRFLFRKAKAAGLSWVSRIMDAKGCVDMGEGKSRSGGVLVSLNYRIMDFLVCRKLRKRLGGRLRFVFSAAGALPERICRLYMALGITILEGYGATETCNSVTLNPIEAVKPGSAGRFCKGVEYRLAEDGELLVKGKSLFKEYWNNPMATEAAFTSDGFYRTGDVVEVQEDGYLRVIDRKKGMLMLATGHRVASAKIETLFSLSSYIEKTVTIGDDRPFPVALIVPDFGAFIRMFRASGLFIDEGLVRQAGEGYEVSPEFVRMPEVVAMIEIEIALVNEKLQGFEKIRNYMILHENFTMESGELTPTLKVRRDVVMARYGDEVEKLYKKGPVLG